MMARTLDQIPFPNLKAGMKFCHPKYGDQIILDLGRGPLGLAIFFHNSTLYNGKMPELEEETENIYEATARKTYPYGSEQWQYTGEISPEEVFAHGWRWQRVTCPHCGFVHRLLAITASIAARSCRNCGMDFKSPMETEETT